MKEKDAFVVSGLMLFLFVLWLGFFIHRDPRFAGSLMGGLFAVSGSLLLLIPFVYSVIKRVRFLKTWVTKRVTFRTLLSIHIYAAILGAILVLIHTGHKFDGLLATTLTTFLLIEIASGYVGRYLFSQITKEIGEKKRLAASLEGVYSKKAMELSVHPEQLSMLKPFTGVVSRVFSPFFLKDASTSPSISRAREVLDLAESISDVEYSVKTHELVKKMFSGWLKIHIVISFVFYALLFLHVGGQIYFGLRWFR